MKLIYEIHKSWKPNFTNFGDELNLWLWPRLIRELLDEDESVLFVGIGTVLDDTLPRDPVKIIFGAGNGYRPLPRIDDTYRFFCVRGPLTAKALGLPVDYAITDPAVLVRIFVSSKEEADRNDIVLMGHYTSAMNADWSFAARTLGMSFVHPLSPWEDVLEAIRGAKLVVTEAMHGAIVADALRVPWVPVITSASDCPFKWNDWTQSLGMEYRPIRLPALWDKKGPPASQIARARRWMKQRLLLRRLSPANLSRHTQLSSDAAIALSIDRLLEKVDVLKLDAASEGWTLKVRQPCGRFRTRA